ncbi:uncharacterized protein EI90DRAFT_3025528 [Cantharellus anzutake]|uniref:uncharacterized protein n=1 Tax=Cantharellus anzutake TaxID=1750568 RepID=UPI0019046C0E|nr:uncharacterized protein EI90DRAFT_3025528 [Cantharellus anzutake]KAF8308998.1 hypothetical protein EI90DRAFT_3025528 [Cantharellus anzutake]
MASITTTITLAITLVIALILVAISMRKAIQELREKQDVPLEDPVSLRTVKRTIPREVPLSVKEYVEELYKETGDENVWNLLPRTPNGPGEFHPYRFYPPGDCIGLETGISEQRPKIFYIHECETEEEFEEECWPEAED